MKRFGFIFHPLDIGLYADGFSEPDLKRKRSSLVEKVMTWLPPFKRATVTGIRSLRGDEIEGDMVLVSLLPHQIIGLDSDFVLEKIIKAGKIAQELGDRIVGLGAYAANVGKKGVLIAKSLDIPVTTGSSYTVAVAIEATMRAAEEIEIDLSRAKAAVIGATGTIGSVCSQILAHRIPSLTLVARNQQRLGDLASAILRNSSATVQTTSNLGEAITEANIVVTATSTPRAIIDVGLLNPGSIVCDISRPRNVPEEVLNLREDVLVIEGGIVKPPGNADFRFSFGLPPGLAYACMAETMILTLEERYESYSIGGNVTLDKVNEISNLAKKHGFELADLRSFDSEVSKAQIEKVRGARRSSKKVVC